MTATASKKTRGNDVEVHHTKGCDLCGSTDRHRHTQEDWHALIASVGRRLDRA